MIEWQLVDGAQNTITLEQWLDYKNKLALLAHVDFGRFIGSSIIEGVARGIQPMYYLDYHNIMRRKIRRCVQLSKLK